jgi:hypothetical protein
MIVSLSVGSDLPDRGCNRGLFVFVFVLVLVFEGPSFVLRGTLVGVLSTSGRDGAGDAGRGLEIP